MPLRALKPAVLLSADSGATQQIPQRPQGLGPSPPPAAPSGSQSEPWMEALEAGMCEARLSGTLHPGCHFGVAQSFALSCSSSDFFFFWHICFLASFLYMCLGVWGEKKKHKEWVAPDPKLSPWKKEYKQHSCIMNFLDLHHMASEPPASRWPSWGRRHWSGLRQKGYRSLLLGQADLRTSLILLGQLSGILTSCLVTCSTCSAGCSLVTRYFACSLLPPAVSTTHHVAPFRSAALCLVQRIQGGAPRPSHDITYPNCLPLRRVWLLAWLHQECVRVSLPHAPLRDTQHPPKARRDHLVQASHFATKLGSPRSKTTLAEPDCNLGL